MYRLNNDFCGDKANKHAWKIQRELVTSLLFYVVYKLKKIAMYW